jgi:hypothetical protein
MEACLESQAAEGVQRDVLAEGERTAKLFREYERRMEGFVGALNKKCIFESRLTF